MGSEVGFLLPSVMGGRDFDWREVCPIFPTSGMEISRPVVKGTAKSNVVAISSPPSDPFEWAPLACRVRPRRGSAAPLSDSDERWRLAQRC